MRSLTLLVTCLVTVAVTGCTQLLPSRLFTDGSDHLRSMPPLNFETCPAAAPQAFHIPASVVTRAKLGDAIAQEEVGHAYLQARELDLAQPWLEKAVAAGLPLAHYDLAHLLLAQSTDREHTNRALVLLISAHQAGIAEASLMLGHIYRTGERVPKDLENAFMYYHVAANRGLPEGAYQLGKSYADGMGTAKNTEEAHYWLQKACSLELPQACDTLSHLESDTP